MPNDAGTRYEGFCPADVKAKLDAAIANGTGIGSGNTELFNQYKLTGGSLIGQIYHAQMYANVNTLSNDCATVNAVNLATANQPAFENTDSAGGTPGKFVVSYPTGSKLFSCVRTNSWAGKTSYTAFGFENNAISALTARYDSLTSSPTNPAADMFQVYLALDSATLSATTPTPTFLAFNSPQAAGSRTIVLSNLTDHKFAAKFGWGGSQIVAYGMGGVDVATGARVPGHYVAKVFSANNPSVLYCVDNTTNAYSTILDTEECGSTLPAYSTITGTTIMSYLNANATDTAALVNYSAFFDDMTQVFSDAQRPVDEVFPHTTCTGTVGYPCVEENLKNFPNVIR